MLAGRGRAAPAALSDGDTDDDTNFEEDGDGDTDDDMTSLSFERAIGSYGAGDRQFKRPFGVAALPGGRLAVADWGNHRVVVLAPTA